MTAPRNPSELARLEEELEEEKKVAKSPSWPKRDREIALQNVRKIEETLGIKSAPYNSEDF